MEDVAKRAGKGRIDRVSEIMIGNPADRCHGVLVGLAGFNDPPRKGKLEMPGKVDGLLEFFRVLDRPDNRFTVHHAEGFHSAAGVNSFDQ